MRKRSGEAERKNFEKSFEKHLTNVLESDIINKSPQERAISEGAKATERKNFLKKVLKTS